MIKNLFNRKQSAKNIASNYSSYSDYAKNASDSEKKMVVEDAIKKANQMQKDLVASS